MCGRFTIAVEKETLDTYVTDRYEVESISEFIVPIYNISPGNKIISVINNGTKNRIGLLKWGYLPDFPIKDKIGFINARSETLFDKPSFKKAALKQRCIIIADGYYEWDKYKQPMRITTDQKLFGIAGIWNTFIDSDGNKNHTVAIVTTNARDDISSIHERMPVILTKEKENIWLNPYQNIEELKSVLKPYEGRLDAYPVSKEVNYSNNNYSGLIVNIN